jgi:hypothetical protein
VTLAELRTALRQRLDDLASPQLWSDDELTAYLNEAQREAAERALLLYDSSSSVTQLRVSAGTALYNVDPLVLRIDRAVLASNGNVLRRTTTDELDNEVCHWLYIDAYGVASANTPWELRTGQPRGYIEQIGSIRLVPIPTSDDLVKLSLWRVPLEDMADDGDEPEIPPRHHARLIDWGERCAYLKRDSDTYDANKAALAEARFTAFFGERPDANVQRKRQIRRVPIVRAHW